jgi:hypothetical protein
MKQGLLAPEISHAKFMCHDYPALEAIFLTIRGASMIAKIAKNIGNDDTTTSKVVSFISVKPVVIDAFVAASIADVAIDWVVKIASPARAMSFAFMIFLSEVLSR